MFEESMSIPAIWASMNSWFTPAVLFVLLNAMIGTIFVTSRLPTSKQQTKDDPQQQQTHLHRSPSVLQRLKSINFHHYTHSSQELTTTTAFAAFATDTAAVAVAADTAAGFIPTPQSDTHQQEERTHEEEEEEAQEEEKSLDEVYSQLQGGRQVSRSVSDTKPSTGEVPVKLARKMKKSASAKSAFAHFEEEDIVETRRPATVRERKAKMTEEEGDDEEVDAKADDFINKFKQQLKLQRLDSIIRYKEMLTRGSGK